MGMEAPDGNSIRLKDKLLAELPGLEAYKQGRDALLAFKNDVGSALKQASDYSHAIAFGKAAKILQKHMLDHKSTFDAAFSEGCIQEVISLNLQFVGMVENGADIKSQLRFGVSKTNFAIASCYNTTVMEGTVRGQKFTDT